jgi:hypothetical protein
LRKRVVTSGTVRTSSLAIGSAGVWRPEAAGVFLPDFLPAAGAGGATSVSTL